MVDCAWMSCHVWIRDDHVALSTAKSHSLLSDGSWIRKAEDEDEIIE